MGIGSMAASKRWALLIQAPVPTILFSRLQDNRRLFHPCWMRGSEVSFESGLMSPHHLVLEGCELLHRDALRPNACSIEAVHSIRHISSNAKELNMDKKSCRSPCENRSINMEGDSSACHAILTASSSSQFNLLMENLSQIDDMFAGTHLVRLEREIMVHIGRLGAQKFFQASLSRTSTAKSKINSSVLLNKHFADNLLGFQSTEHNSKKLVSTGKKEQRKLRRTRASERVAKMSSLSAPTKRVGKVEQSTVSFRTVVSGGPIASSQSKSRRAVIVRNESEMSRGVKEVANLERTRIKLEEETGRPASYARWAEAAGLDQKTLHQRLQFGWCCRDKLIRSTRSLVVYLAKNYRGMGIAFDDLLQAGNVGVLNGAERFDTNKGYRFSTYVQYWIRKSILALVARHSRGIQIPSRMEKIIKQIQNARRALCNKEGRYPPDEQTAEFTGLPLAKVRLARKCSRVLGSIDKEIGNGWLTKFREVTPDTSLLTPDEVIVKRHMREDILELLEDLHPRERQVLLLRYGFEDGRCKSLEEIGRLLHVTKECIRKVEKVALSKIARKDIQADLKHYLDL